MLIEVNDVGSYFAVSGGGSSDHGKHTNLDSFLLQAQNSIYLKNLFSFLVHLVLDNIKRIMV